MNTDKVQELIQSGITNSKVEVVDTTGTNDHFSVIVISDSFEGLSLIEQHQMVYKAVGSFMTNEIHALENEDIYESDSEEDGDPEYSFDSMEDNEFPMDQLLMILLKHFYRGGIFIVGDLNMRLSSDEESINANLFKNLRCDDSEAIEKVRELDLNTRAPLKDVGNFKVDYPYALPPSYDFGNFQMKFSKIKFILYFPCWL